MPISSCPRRSITGRALLLSIAAGLALTACARAPGTPEPKHFFPEAAARHLFADGYRHVQERYIDAISAEALAFSGFRGLTHLAPELQVHRTGNEVVLAVAGRPVRSLPAPAEGDSEEWGRLTAALLQAGWSASPALRQRKPEEIYNSMFAGLVDGLDGYSRYTDAASAEQARASREGFGGIGIAIDTGDGRIRITRVMDDAPARRAGLRERDEITAIDGEPATGLSHTDIVDRLRGPIGSPVQVSVRRGNPGQPLGFEIVREHIVPQTVTWERDGDLAYIRLSSFNRHTTAEVRRAVAEARREIGSALRGLILDLRSNPGGLLDEAVSVADLFLKDGLIVATRGRHPASNSAFSADEEDIAAGLPIAVLINGKSASAAEMLAAALQDQGRAVVVGSASHGKGSVQNVVRMPNGGELIVTWSRMVAPSGYVLDRLGVLPAVCTSGGSMPDEDGDVSRRLRELKRRTDSQFVAWHSYTDADEAVARTLRLACPAEPVERDSDREVAERLVREPKFYRLALRPWSHAAIAAERPAAGPVDH